MIKCKECLTLISNLETFFNRPLIDAKDWGVEGGGLIKPKKDIVKICQVCEKHISIFSLNNELKKGNFYAKLLQNCFAEISNSYYFMYHERPYFRLFTARKS